MMGFYQDLLVRDLYPVNTFNNRLVSLIQDLVAPFLLFTRSEYRMNYGGMGDTVMQTKITLKSEVSARIGSYRIKNMTCELTVGTHGLERFVIFENEKETEVNLVSER